MPCEHPQEKEMFEFQVCPKCRTAVLDAPGIGQYCPNKDCDVVDNLLGVQPHKIIAFVDPELAALRLDYISAVGQAQTALEERDALRAEVERLRAARDLWMQRATALGYPTTVDIRLAQGVGVVHEGCNYLGTPGLICNKCGRSIPSGEVVHGK